ncbi:MAG: DEAD/DEAH box helicase [Legionellaceae bacterium]|nr:DEAD/DEAH box helicase [Legionellaceae bacterium]
MPNEQITFSNLNLSDALLKAIAALGFETPSPIQQQTIPWMLQKRDMIALAQTGTGKTAAFGLPILQNLQPELTGPQALILAPTRELAIQVGEHIETLGLYQKGVRVTVLCGGQDYRPQLKKLREGAQIVVGTPGRILDHIERGTLVLNNLRTFVLDEADEMLRMGFIEDVETVLAKLPEERQIALFSATMPPRIRQIASRYLKDPVSVEIRMETATVKTVEQRFLVASQSQKPDALLRVLAVEDYQGVIVFVRTKSSTEEVAESLIQQGHRAMAIHGDITQSLRERIISQFKQGAIDILVATDVAARGLDVDRVTHVINYDMAHDCETYVHRIGRTGRAGRSGVTILFAAPRESRMLTIIERHTRQRIEKMTIPNDFMIQQAREVTFMKKIHERMGHADLPAYKRIIDAYLQRNVDASVVDVAAVLAFMLNQDKPWATSLPPVKADRSPKDARVRVERDRHSKGPRVGGRDNDKSSGRDERRALPADYVQELYRIDVGRVHGVKPGNIVGAIANESGLQSRYITALKIHDDHSTVRLPKDIDSNMIHALNKAWVCGRQMNLKVVGA